MSWALQILWAGFLIPFPDFSPTTLAGPPPICQVCSCLRAFAVPFTEGHSHSLPHSRRPWLKCSWPPLLKCQYPFLPYIYFLSPSFTFCLVAYCFFFFLLYYAFYLFMLFPMCPPPAYKLHNSRVSFSCFSVLFTQYLEQCFSTFFPTVVPLNRIFQIFVFIAQLHYWVLRTLSMYLIKTVWINRGSLYSRWVYQESRTWTETESTHWISLGK